MPLYIQLLLSGLLAGLYSATWGTIKDTRFEKFRIISFIRSPILGMCCGILLYFFLQTQSQIVISSPLVYFFVCVALERCHTETYKLFFRRESQHKYNIPQRFAFYGRCINNHLSRLFLGIILMCIFYLFIFWWRSFIINIQVNRIIGAAMAASVGGVLGSVLGANKDAPIEGFGTLLLFRSEILAVLLGLLFIPLTNDYIVLGFAATGAERTVIEFYKTFIIRKKPGKFK
jgi:hypothetical protein